MRRYGRGRRVKTFFSFSSINDPRPFKVFPFKVFRPLNILHVLMRDEIFARLRVLGDIGLDRLTVLERAVLDPAASGSGVTRQGVGAVFHREIRYADLVGVAVDDGRQAEVVGRHLLVADVQFEVAPVVELRPLQLAVVLGQVVAGVVGFREGDVLAVWTWARDGRAGEFDSDASLSTFRVIGVFVQPDQIADPVRM